MPLLVVARALLALLLSSMDPASGGDVQRRGSLSLKGLFGGKRSTLRLSGGAPPAGAEVVIDDDAMVQLHPSTPQRKKALHFEQR